MAVLEARLSQIPISPKKPVRRRRRVEAKLSQLINDYFNEDELTTLAYEFGLEYEELGGNGRLAKSQALVGHFGRRDLLDTLLAQLMEERPNVDWYGILVGKK